MPPVLPLLLSIILSFTAAAAAGSLTIPPAAAAFFATWDAAAISPCNFSGITCDPVGRGVVTGISMRHLGIAADPVPFDDVCGRLPTLLTLSLPDNFWLAGDISGWSRAPGSSI